MTLAPPGAELYAELHGPASMLFWKDGRIVGVVSVWHEDGRITKMQEQSLTNLRAGAVDA